MNTEQERAEFEAWYRLHHGSRDVYGRDASGEYVDKQVQGAFNVWQARAALTAQPAASAEPVAWVAADTIHAPHPACVSSLAYMSQLDKDRGREYVPLYAAPVAAEVEALRAEVAAWRELSDHVRAGACAAIWPDRYTDARTRDVAAALKRAARLREALSAYQAAVNKIDDLIEYALPMPRETKAALYAVLADLTDALVEGSKHEQDQ